MDEGQVIIRVCLPYKAGKISSCNFRDTKPRREIQYFFNSTHKTIAGKHLIGTSIVQKSHFHVHSITPFAVQVKIASGR